jgi:hypothetical protein
MARHCKLDKQFFVSIGLEFLINYENLEGFCTQSAKNVKNRVFMSVGQFFEDYGESFGGIWGKG